MKRILLAPVFLVVMTAGCQNKTGTNITPGSNTSVSGTVTTGKWVVSYFYDNDKEETSDYNGYTFEFKNDNTLTATRNSGTITGTWNEVSDDGFQKMVIALNTTDDKLKELNDDWVIESRNDTQVKLKDDNPARNEQLHFSKQ